MDERTGGQHGRIDGRTREAFRGCLLGGAVGDALGAPVEFMPLAELRARFGAGGVTDLVAGEWPPRVLAGERGIPAAWLDRLELREVIGRVADDLWAHFGDGRPDRCDDAERYPSG